MTLHHYTSSPSYLGVYHHHHGDSFGSIFARIFSKMAVKTAAGLKLATELGTDLSIQGINKLENAAINKGLPSELVHNVSSVAKEGAHKAISRVGTLPSDAKTP